MLNLIYFDFVGFNHILCHELVAHLVELHDACLPLLGNKLSFTQTQGHTWIEK